MVMNASNNKAVMYHRGQRDIAYSRCKRHTSYCSGEKCRTIIPHEIQSFHMHTAKGHELAFPKSSDVQFRHLLIELFLQEAEAANKRGCW